MRITNEYEIEVFSPAGWNDVLYVGIDYESVERIGYTTGPNSVGPVYGETKGEIVDKLIDLLEKREES